MNSPVDTEKILDLLRAAPGKVAAVTEGLPPERLCTPSGPGEWSANEVLAHMRSCADVWGECIATMRAQDKPTIRAVNPRTWIKKTDYCEMDFHESLKAYIEQRARLLTILEQLTPDEWQRPATVTGAGKVLERTIFFYAQWLATHERPHIKQIKRIVEDG